MVRNGDLREIKVKKISDNLIKGKSRDDAHEYIVYYSPNGNPFTRSKFDIRIVFNKFREEKRICTKRFDSISRVYDNRQEHINKIFKHAEELCN